MRRTWIAAIGLVLLVVGFVAIRSLVHDRDVREAVPRATAETASEAPVEKLVVSEETPGPAPVADRAQVADEFQGPIAASPSSDADCVVHGRVVDESDVPLAGVLVALSAYKVWAEGRDVPRLPGPYDSHGWEILTSATGEFRFEAPTPTAQIVALVITPDDFHDSAVERFGTVDSGMRSPLHAGENDLGTFRLVATGAIRGSVVDESGNPIPNAKLRIANDRSTTLEREGATDVSGRYVIPSVKQGSYGVNAQARGYLSEFKKPFDVSTGKYTDGVDFALRAAPTLSGIVMDPQRHPLEGAKLHGWPTSSGAGAGAQTAADGSFTIYLPQDEPYTLEVKLDGYAPFGMGDRSHLYTPGSKALEIVLEPLGAGAKLRFTVVDAKTATLIERFGFEVELERGDEGGESNVWSQRPRPAPADHPGGEFEAIARPGVDRLTVVAPGYRPLQTEIRPGDSTPGAMVVRMSRGSRLIGRAMIGSEPAAGAEIRLEAGWMSGPDEAHFEAGTDDVITATTGTDGRFALEGLSSGTHRLVIRTEGGYSVTRDTLWVKSKGDTDLGDLALEPSGAIAGRVLVPASRQAAGLPVYLDEWKKDQKLPTDAEGRFRFEGVPAGAHTLFVGEVPGILAGTEMTGVVVEAGRTLEVVLDARERGTCSVALTIDVGKAPAEGLRVALFPVADPKAEIELGTTDASGRVSSWARAAGAARIEISGNDWSGIVHPTAVLQLDLDAKIELTVSFEVGSACFELPESIELPALAWGTLKCTDGDIGRRGFNGLSFELANGASATKSVSFDGAARKLCFAIVPVGDCEVQLDIVDRSAPPVKTTTANGFRIAQKSILSAKASLHVRAGESCEIKLP